MCGIVGFYSPRSESEDRIKSQITKMTDCLIHRGPDASGIWIEPNNVRLAFGHRRLSIIDLTATGAQPMTSHSGRYIITYNGEIYNARDVLDLMRKDGYNDTMRGTSDTEILLEAVEYYGVFEAVGMCKGMFAFAVYDTEDKTLTLARDRIGEKPLYYGEIGGSFVFASELSAIRAFEGFEAELNYDIISDYLKHGYIPAPHTIYANCRKLEPGTILEVKYGLNNRPVYNTSVYWDIMDVARHGQENMFTGSAEEAAEVLEELLKSSIKQQMISDVPLGAFLSAGIDSSTIVSLMQSVSNDPVRTFTIGFEEEAYNEADAASAIAASLGTRHTELYATRQDALDVIPGLAGMFGEPFADTSQIPTYLVSSLTRGHVTVALSGDGGDELFAGYRDHAGVYNIYKKIRGIPYPLRAIGSALMRSVPGDGERSRRIRAHGMLLGASGPADLYRRTYETWPGLYGLLGEAVLEKRDPSAIGHTCAYDTMDCGFLGDDVIHTAMLMNMKMYHPDDILCKVDRTAMAVSLETRIPLLDRDVVEFAWTLPLKYLRDDREGKLILRSILYKYVDRELMDRPKHGFSVPVAEWLKDGGLREWASDLFNQDSINQAGILDGENASKLWNDYISKGIWRPQIWNVLMLNSWLSETANA